MTTAILESLLLDRALGELSPEVTALLDAYLVHDKESTMRSADIAETLRLARIAHASPVESSRRPLDLERLRRTARADTTRKRLREMWRLAACIAIGLGLGLSAHAPQREANVVVATPHQASFMATTSPTGPTTQFWSRARLVAEERSQPLSSTHRNKGYQLDWSSPTKLPLWKKKL